MSNPKLRIPSQYLSHFGNDPSLFRSLMLSNPDSLESKVTQSTIRTPVGATKSQADLRYIENSINKTLVINPETLKEDKEETKIRRLGMYFDAPDEIQVVQAAELVTYRKRFYYDRVRKTYLVSYVPKNKRHHKN